MLVLKDYNERRMYQPDGRQRISVRLSNLFTQLQLSLWNHRTHG